MHPTYPAPPSVLALALGAMLLAGTASAQALLALQIQGPGAAEPLLVDLDSPEARHQVEAFLRSPPGGDTSAAGSLCAQLIGDFLDPVRRAQYSHLAGLSREGAVLVTLHPWDEGAVFPASHSWGPGSFPAIALGEHYLSRDGGSLERARAVLGHELAHAGDGAACSMPEEDRYGPDRAHLGREIMTPATAFAEGWAHYRARALGRDPDLEADLAELESYQRRDWAAFFYWEQRGRERDYVPLACWDMTLLDLLSNEVMVTWILVGLDELLGLGGELERAFQESVDVPCRALPDLLAAAVKDDVRLRKGAANVLRLYTLGYATPTQIEALLDGRLPADRGVRIERNQVPRSGDYGPSEAARICPPPAREVEVPPGDEGRGSGVEPAGPTPLGF